MKSFPQKTKYKKQKRGSYSNKIFKTLSLSHCFNKLSLCSLESGELNVKQLDTLKKSLNKIIKKRGFFRLFVFCDIPVTKKPLEIRMGKGKGSLDHWIVKIKKGAVICSVNTIDSTIGLKALNSARYRLPLKTKII
jgi:large subunit ribosomal protein L16